MLIDILTPVIAIGTLAVIMVPQPAPTSPTTGPASFFHEFADGFRYVWVRRALMIVVITCTIANIFLGPARSFLPLLITRDFGGNALQLSLVFSPQGIGLISGGAS